MAILVCKEIIHPHNPKNPYGKHAHTECEWLIHKGKLWVKEHIYQLAMWVTTMQNPVRERRFTPNPKYEWKHTRFLSVENVNDSGNGSHSWLRETKTGKNPLRETHDVSPSARMNRTIAPAWGWTNNGDNGVVERMESSHGVMVVVVSEPTWGSTCWWSVRVGKGW